MKTLETKMNKQSGFTLIEIAIVLVIIGLLLGGVLQGQQLIENSRVRSAVNDFNGTAAAAFSYVDRYGRFPGDDGPTATLTARGTSWTGLTGGDTDGILDGNINAAFTATGELGYFWQHLRAAGFIAGDPTNAAVAALPQNPFGGVIGVTAGVMMNGLAGTKVCMSNVTGSGAIALDTQLDDGAGATGRFRATLGVSGANTAPNAAVLAAAYSEDNVYTVCYRI
tara:strand:+ start:1484 stop:2155 length:672 start_codon:yes stop_codon:yes gene_type:complete